jgi:hypothetical protein
MLPYLPKLDSRVSEDNSTFTPRVRGHSRGASYPPSVKFTSMVVITSTATPLSIVG